MATRRSTLAAVSSSAVNSRASLGPARRGSAIPRASLGGHKQASSSSAGAGKPTTPSNMSQRPSMSGRAASLSLGGRQSFAPSGSGSAHRIQDPRNLADRAVFSKNIKDLISFLVERGYPEPISQKSLLTPSVKDFKSILEFMTQLHDPCWRLSDKYEEDVTSLFKRLGYPLNISKRVLTSVGTQHTWPHLLGALVWWMKLLLFMEDIDARERQFMEKTPEGMFYLWLANAYERWMHEEDPEVLEEELAEIFAGQISQVNENLSQISSMNASIQAQLEEFRNNPSLVVKNRTLLTALQSDLQKFHQLVDTLETYRGNVINKIRSEEEKQELRRTEIQQLVEKRRELDEKLEKQELTPADVERMNRDLRRLEEQLSLTTKQKEDVISQLWNLESEFGQLMSDLDRQVFEYNSMATKLKLLPMSAKHAGGRDFELRINRDATRFEELVTLDLKGVLKPKLRTIMDLSREKCESKQRQMIEEESRMNSKRDELSDQEEELQRLESELNKLEELYRVKKEQLGSNLSRFKQEVADLEYEVQELRSGPSLSPEDTQKRITELQELYQRLGKDFEEENKKINEKLLMALGQITDHKLYMSEKLAELLSHHTTFEEKVMNEEGSSTTDE